MMLRHLEHHVILIDGRLELVACSLPILYGPSICLLVLHSHWGICPFGLPDLPFLLPIRTRFKLNSSSSVLAWASRLVTTTLIRRAMVILAAADASNRKNGKSSNVQESCLLQSTRKKRSGLIFSIYYSVCLSEP